MRLQSSLVAASLAVALSLTNPTLAQQTGQGGGGTGGGGTGGGTTTAPGPGAPTGNIPGNVPGNTQGRPTSPFPNDPNRMPDLDQFQNRPIFLSGKVLTQDGTPPPETATIERVCAGIGTPIPEGYTDSKGRFSFQVGQRLGMLPDASMGNTADVFAGRSQNQQLNGMNGGQMRVTERDLQMCELRASLPGYRSSVIPLAGRRSMDNPDVGTIILRRLADVTGYTTSATSLMAPKEAKKAFEKAQNHLKKNKLPDAQKELETAVSLHPKYAEAYFQLGNVLGRNNDAAGARAAFAKAIEADPKYINPYLGIAQMDAQEQKWSEVKATTEKVIALNRYDFPHAYFYGAVAEFNLQNTDEAEKLCRTGIEMDQYHRIPKMNHLLGMILASKEDYAGAQENLQSYLKFAPRAPDADVVKKQLAEIQGRVAQAKPE
jgi:tetratricopeptide (TPR) repeat protein